MTVLREVQTGRGDKPEPRSVGCTKKRTVCRESLEVQSEGRSWDKGVGLPPLPESEMAAGGKRKGESCPFSQSELLFAFWKGEGPALGSRLVEMPCYSEGSPGNKQPGYASNWLFWKRPDEGRHEGVQGSGAG